MINSYFPFSRLGYKCNPFRAVTNEEWMALAVLLPPVEAALANGFEHLQVLGEKGHGKTTTLLAIEAHFRREARRAAYEHLEVEANAFTTPLEALDLFCLDEAQRLAASERARLLNAVKHHTGLHLVLGTHEDFAVEFRRRGLLLTTIQLETVPLTHVEAVVSRRLSFFALDPGRPGWQPTHEAIAALHARFGADVRRIEQALYEAYQYAVASPEATEIDEAVVRRVAS